MAETQPEIAKRALHLNGDREQSLAGWLKQARQFFDGALKRRRC